MWPIPDSGIASIAGSVEVSDLSPQDAMGPVGRRRRRAGQRRGPSAALLDPYGASSRCQPNESVCQGTVSSESLSRRRREPSGTLHPLCRRRHADPWVNPVIGMRGQVASLGDDEGWQRRFPADGEACQGGISSAISLARLRGVARRSGLRVPFTRDPTGSQRSVCRAHPVLSSPWHPWMKSAHRT